MDETQDGQVLLVRLTPRGRQALLEACKSEKDGIEVDDVVCHALQVYAPLITSGPGTIVVFPTPSGEQREVALINPDPAQGLKQHVVDVMRYFGRRAKAYMFDAPPPHGPAPEPPDEPGNHVRVVRR